ncbi:MAG: response regulator [bacterium]|nr:response regulator [bacterium]
MRYNILVVDDEESILDALYFGLSDSECEVKVSRNPQEALQVIDNSHVDLTVTDIRMPEMDGLTLLKEIKKRHPETAVIILTAFGAIDSAVEAMRAGATYYFTKPVNINQLRLFVHQILKQRTQIIDELGRHFLATIETLITAIDARDHHTSGHSQRVSKVVEILARKIGLTGKEIISLRQAALLHDIGKIGISDAILKKTTPLSKEEYEICKLHPVIGAYILKPIEFLHDRIPVIFYHQERVDGKGYPQGLTGEQIPLGARIVSIADSYDAMISGRPYRAPLSKSELIAEFTRCAGTQFDLQLTEVFLKIISEDNHPLLLRESPSLINGLDWSLLSHIRLEELMQQPFPFDHLTN